MKNTLSLLSVATVAVLLVGCSKPEDAQVNQQADTQASAEVTPQAAQTITPQSLFDQYVVASYGDKGLDAFSSLVMNGELVIEEAQFSAPFKLKQMAPDSRRFETDMLGYLVGGGCSAGECWKKDPYADLKLLSGEELAFENSQADFFKLKHMGKYYKSLEIVKGKDDPAFPQYHVKATRENGKVDVYKFSKQSKMLTTIVMDSGSEKTQVTINHSGYKKFNGFLFPTVVDNISAGNTMTMNIENIEFDTLKSTDFGVPES